MTETAYRVSTRFSWALTNSPPLASMRTAGMKIESFISSLRKHPRELEPALPHIAQAMGQHAGFEVFSPRGKHAVEHPQNRDDHHRLPSAWMRKTKDDSLNDDACRCAAGERRELALKIAAIDQLFAKTGCGGERDPHNDFGCAANRKNALLGVASRSRQLPDRICRCFPDHPERRGRRYVDQHSAPARPVMSHQGKQVASFPVHPDPCEVKAACFERERFEKTRNDIALRGVGNGTGGWQRRERNCGRHDA